MLLNSAPTFKVALRIVKVSRVQNLNTKFLEHRINAFFKEVLSCISSYVTSQGCNGILRILPIVVEITNKHVQFPQAYSTHDRNIRLPALTPIASSRSCPKSETSQRVSLEFVCVFGHDGVNHAQGSSIRAHGIAPVRRCHSAYRYMRDGDGVVCE